MFPQVFKDRPHVASIIFISMGQSIANLLLPKRLAFWFSLTLPERTKEMYNLN